MKTEREQVIMASILGDGHIAGKDRTPFLRVHHSLDQLDYLKWKSKFFYDCTGIFANDESCYFQTRASDEFVKYANMFYVDMCGYKIFNECVFDYMSPLFFAIWYLDDGSYIYGSNRCRIASFVYDKENLVVIANHLLNVYGFDVRVNKLSFINNKQTYSLCFTVDASDKFLKYIYDYVPKCMSYKLGHVCASNDSVIKMYRSKRINNMHRNEYNKIYYYANRDKILAQKKIYDVRRKLFKV